MKVDWIEIIYIVIIFQILLFVTFLLIKKPRYTANYLLSIFLISHAAGSFCSLSYLQSYFFFVEHPHLAFLGYPFVFLWGPAFYFYVLALAFKNLKFRPIDLLHLVPFLFAVIFFSVTFYFYDAETKKVIVQDYSSYPVYMYEHLIDIFLKLQLLFYIIRSFHVLRTINKKIADNPSAGIKINFQWLKFTILGYTVCYIIFVPFSFIVYTFHFYNKFFLLGDFLQYFLYFNMIFFKAWNQPQLFSSIDENEKYKTSKLIKEEALIWIDKLDDFINQNKPYLNSDLTLPQLAEAINIQPRILSQILNEYFNQNFYDYINQLRVEESKKMLINSSKTKTISEIFLEAGFNSKATFNRAFKKVTGLSPTEFIKKNTQQVAIRY